MIEFDFHALIRETHQHQWTNQWCFANKTHKSQEYSGMFKSNQYHHPECAEFLQNFWRQGACFAENYQSAGIL